MSERLRIVVADDELLARKRLRRLVEAMPDCELVGECTNGEEVLRTVAERPLDVLLLDIHMPGLTGIEVKALLRDDGPRVIFTTAHPEHALEAFDVGAVDYVLKPIEAHRLATALERARAGRIGASATAGARAGVGGDDGTEAARNASGDASDGAIGRLALPTREGARLIPFERITHAVFDGALVSVHVDAEVLLTELALSDLEARLPRDAFERVHRRALVNLHRVERLVDQPTGGYVAITDTGAKVEVSRQAARELRRRLGLR